LVVGAAKHPAVRNARSRAILLVSVVARAPRVEILDFEVESEVFVIHLVIDPCEKLSRAPATRVARAANLRVPTASAVQAEINF
jgi:hypothetical protein